MDKKRIIRNWLSSKVQDDVDRYDYLSDADWSLSIGEIKTELTDKYALHEHEFDIDDIRSFRQATDSNHNDSLFRSVIHPLTKTARAYKIAAFDIETHGVNNDFLMGSIVSDKEKFYSWDQDELIKKLLSSSYEGYLIFATNLEFDLFALFPKKKLLSKNFRLIFRKSRLICAYAGQPATAKREHNGKRYNNTFFTHQRKFLDTMNFMPASVERLGSLLKLPKLEKPDFLGEIPRNRADRLHLIHYNLRDSEITYRFAVWLQSGINRIGGEMKSTMAATSMWLFRHKYQKDSMSQPNINIMNDTFKAYYGGRCEVFTRGRLKDHKLYDINGLYSEVMKYSYPMSDSLYIKDDPSMDDVLTYQGVTFCHVKTPEIMRYPFLPYRAEDGKLIFPLGEWDGWYCNNELTKAVELGYHIIPKKAYLYRYSYFPFARCNEDYYRMRLDDPDNGLIYKLLSNSLYGKWAMRWDSQLVYEEFDKLKDIPKNLVDVKGDYAILEEEGEPADYVNPIYSAYCTAYGRIKLYGYITAYKAKYCDTDSIITDMDVPCSSEQGAMKLERTFKEVHVIKPKMYIDPDMYKPLLKFKGMRFKSAAAFLKAVEMKTGNFERFIKFKESVRRGLTPFQKIVQTKRVDIEDTKRGWNAPYEFGRTQVSVPLHVTIPSKRGQR